MKFFLIKTVIMKNILKQISTTLKILPPSHRKIAKYIFHNLDKAIFLTATQIVIRAKISKAMIIRFVNTLVIFQFFRF